MFSAGTFGVRVLDTHPHGGLQLAAGIELKQPGMSMCDPWDPGVLFPRAFGSFSFKFPLAKPNTLPPVCDPQKVPKLYLA